MNIAQTPSTCRRTFLARSSAVCLAAAPALLGASPNRRIRVGVMGLGRGKAHIAGFLSQPNVEIVAVCDVDSRRLAEGVKYAAKRQGGRNPEAITDFRRILEDKEVDVLSIAAPNFWHAPATILACAAGKHVYVEKPGSHNAQEAEWMVAAARKHRRKVQMGNQRRSLPSFIEGTQKLREGIVGDLHAARCWYTNQRKSIGKGKPASVPGWLDYKLWQGPAAARPYKDNLVHYNWHWHWHWGNGELGNNGVHALDIARWGLGLGRPLRVSCSGGRYHHDDDQETPDECHAVYEYKTAQMSWNGSSCHPRRHDKLPFASIYGEGGCLEFTSAGYTHFDLQGKEVSKNIPAFSDVYHFKNFVDSIREDVPLNSEIEDAQTSSVLCHLGNIACRKNLVLEIDPDTDRPTQEVDELWGREYEPGWRPEV